MKSNLIVCLLAILIANAGCKKQVPEKTSDSNSSEQNLISVSPPWQAEITDLWTATTHHPPGNGPGDCAFVISGRIFVFGWGNLGNPQQVWEYDDNTQAWTMVSVFPGTYRKEATAFSIGNKGYIFGGDQFSGAFLNELWEFDPITYLWTRKADNPVLHVCDAVGFSINGKGYVATGFSYPETSSALMEYDPVANTWTQKASMPGARSGAFAFVVNNKAYVGGGEYHSFTANGNLDRTYLSNMWEYDPAVDQWTSKASFVTRRYKAASFAIANTGYVGTGYIFSNGNFIYTKDFYAYNPVTNTWIQKSNYGGYPRYNAVGFAANGFGFIGFGETANGDGQNGLWRYDP
jgi:N-acetylneuraminic acid mutarotase